MLDGQLAVQLLVLMTSGSIEVKLMLMGLSEPL